MEHGVKVSDANLDEYDEKPANVWGGAELSEKERDVIKLGKKHSLNTRLDRISNQTEIETALTVIRWNSQGENNEGEIASEHFYDNLQNNNYEEK